MDRYPLYIEYTIGIGMQCDDVGTPDLQVLTA